MEYDVIEAETREELVEHVKAALANGWQLQGGVAIAQAFGEWEVDRKGYTEHQVFVRYAQAVVKPSSGTAP